MLKDIELFYIPSSKEKPMKNLKKYNKKIKAASTAYLNKFFTQASNKNTSPFINYTKALISRIPINTEIIKGFNNDYDLLDYINEIVNNYSGTIESINKIDHGNNILFTSSIGDITEHIMIMKNSNPYKYYPLGKNIDYWKDNHIVDCVYNNSDEFTLTVRNDKLVYNIINPAIVIITIDIVGLLFSYYKYMTKETNDISFMRNFILYPFFLHTINTWLVRYWGTFLNNSYMEYIMSDRISSTIYDDIMYDDKALNFINKELDTAQRDIISIFEEHVKGNITTSFLIQNILIIDGNMTDYIYRINKLANIVSNNSIEALTQLFLKDYNLVNLIIDLYDTAYNPLKLKNLKRILKLVLNKYKNNNVINNSNILIKQSLIELFENIRTKLD